MLLKDFFLTKTPPKCHYVATNHCDELNYGAENINGISNKIYKDLIFFSGILALMGVTNIC